MAMFKKEEETKMDLSVYDNVKMLSSMGKQMIVGMLEDAELLEGDNRKAAKLIDFVWEFYEDLISAEKTKGQILNDLHETVHELSKEISDLKDMVARLQK